MKLGLVTDLDTCIGCHACETACKEWNDSSRAPAERCEGDPALDLSGAWFNRVKHYEIGDYPENKTINFSLSCMHCVDAQCVDVCPTGAVAKRPDGIVLIDQDR